VLSSNQCFTLYRRQYAKRFVDMGYTEVGACRHADTTITN